MYDWLNQCAAQIKPDEPISKHTTIRIGGPARIMAFPADDEQLAELLGAASEREWAEPPYLLGGGANLFADSRGYDGLIVNMTHWQTEFTLDDSGLLVVGGGAALQDVVHEAARRGWAGIDFMAEVPGTVGGATVINAGTNVGGYAEDRFQWTETMSVDGRKHRRGRDEMDFGYRSSSLLYGSEVVLRTAFQLLRCKDLALTPEILFKHFEELMAVRTRNLPLDQPNFGSTFRSPEKPHPPAGKLVDDLGLKGYRVGDAQISPKHGNFIVNLGEASSDDVLAVMEKMHGAVLERHGVRLKPEVHYLSNRDRPRPDFFP